MLNSETIRVTSSGSAFFNFPEQFAGEIRSGASLSGLRFRVDAPSPFVISRSGVFEFQAVGILDATGTAVPAGSMLMPGVEYEFSQVHLNFRVSDAAPNPFSDVVSGVLTVAIPTPGCAALLLAAGLATRPRRGDCSRKLLHRKIL